MSAPSPSTDSETRNSSLDGLRGLAIMLVLVCHYTGYPMPAPLVTGFLKHLLTFTFGGVELFFVLSGFLIGANLMRGDRRPAGMMTFYVRRACRILPVYALLLGSFFVARESSILRQVSGGMYFYPGVPMWSYLLFLQDNLMGIVRSIGPWWLVVSWSLALEVQFYLIAPFLVRRASVTALVALAVVAAFVCPLLRHILFYQIHNPIGAIYLSICRIDSLLMGLAVAALWKTPSAKAWLVGQTRWFGGFVAVFALFFFLGPFSRLGNSEYVITIIPTLLGLGSTGLLLFLLTAPASTCAHAFQSPLLIFMGSISYFVYLFHLPAIYLTHGLMRHTTPDHLDWHGVAATAVALLLVIAAATASRRWIETPFIRLGHRIS